ncbi:hypothetical protein NHH03_09855 [Stieleria sp. TO1_6]|nr:hypothetical protein [Stieleria tagensis]MCO8122041.1 hypothetical protein [Stieleria tagensis]
MPNLRFKALASNARLLRDQDVFESTNANDRRTATQTNSVPQITNAGNGT